MRLTAYSDYTFRALMYLAANAGRVVTISEIARTYGISEAHLTKVVHQLGLAGEVETTRGRRGGLRLRRLPHDINLGEVVRRTEADMELVPCFRDPSVCVLGRTCVLEHALHEAMHAFMAVLDRYTLADLIMPGQPATRLLQVTAGATGGQSSVADVRLA